MKIQISRKVKIIILSVIAVLVAIYLGVALYYSERFLMGTTINEINCSGMKIAEVEALMQSKLETHTITIHADNVQDTTIQGESFDVKFGKIESVKEVLEAQNSFAWPAALFKKNFVEAKIRYTYNEDKLNELISKLDCMEEDKQIPEVSATVVLDGFTFVIQKEELGTVVDVKKLCKTVINNFAFLKENLDLRRDECYVAPKFTEESEEVIAAVEALNKCMETNIAYELESKVVRLNDLQLKKWLSVDEDMNVIISEEGLNSFAKNLATVYNTKPRTEYITTPTGKNVYVKNATYGRSIDKAAEVERLKEEILEGKIVKRRPIIAQEATPEGRYSWGRTYIEVDISAQHMWYIKNGSVIFECDVVTGSPGRDTPTGVYEILTKKRDKVLKGEIDPVTGKREYETPVDYWARVTWTGIGFHDATWQPAFGGQLYKQGYGSHGCINMPYGAVKTFYGMISVGDPVVIHY